MDRFIRGLVAGVIGGIAMNLWSVIAIYVLNLKIISFIDWASIILYGDLPQSHLEGGFALIIQLLWAGFLGVILAFLIQQVSSEYYLIKAGLFGVMVAFIIYAIPVMFKMPHLAKLSFETVLSNHSGGLIWALTAGQMLRILDRTKTQ